MYTFNLKENCRELKSKLQQQYPGVTAKDLDCSDGRNKGEMLEKLQSKLQLAPNELHQIIMKL